jgi:hypothetical protein
MHMLFIHPIFISYDRIFILPVIILSYQIQIVFLSDIVLCYNLMLMHAEVADARLEYR